MDLRSSLSYSVHLSDVRHVAFLLGEIMKYKIIPYSMRLEIRTTAHMCLVAALGREKGAVALAKTLVRKRLRKKYGSFVTSFFLSLAIDLAIALIKYWLLNANYRSVKTTDGFQTGEPGA